MNLENFESNVISYPFELLTERLTICSPAVQDAEQVQGAIEESIESLRPWMPWASHVPTVEETRLTCANAAMAFQNGQDFRLHLFLRDSGILIGGSGLHDHNPSVPSFSIGYWVRQSMAGRGYITEAVAAISEYALTNLGANHLEIRCSSLNSRSGRVAERAGFMLEGILRNESRHLDGSLRDTQVYSRIGKGGWGIVESL